MWRAGSAISLPLLATLLFAFYGMICHPQNLKKINIKEKEIC